MDPITPAKNSAVQPTEITPTAPTRSRPYATRPTTAAIKLVANGFFESFERRVTLDTLFRWSKLLDCEDVASSTQAMTFTMPDVPKDHAEQYYEAFSKIFANMPSLRELKVCGSGSKQHTGAVDVGVEQLMRALVQHSKLITINKFELSATSVNHETLASFFEGQKDNFNYIDLDNVLCCNESWNNVLSFIRDASVTVVHFSSLRASPHSEYALFWGNERPIRSVWNPVTKGLEMVLFDETQVAMTGREAVKAGIEMLLQRSEWKKVV